MGAFSKNPPSDRSPPIWEPLTGPVWLGSKVEGGKEQAWEGEVGERTGLERENRDESGVYLFYSGHDEFLQVFPERQAPSQGLIMR